MPTEIPFYIFLGSSAPGKMELMKIRTGESGEPTQKERISSRMKLSSFFEFQSNPKIRAKLQHSFWYIHKLFMIL